MKDIAEEITRGTYGKSGRANVPENQNPEFQAGYKRGKGDRADYSRKRNPQGI